jgi:hypothetical protein
VISRASDLSNITTPYRRCSSSAAMSGATTGLVSNRAMDGTGNCSGSSMRMPPGPLKNIATDRPGGSSHDRTSVTTASISYSSRPSSHGSSKRATSGFHSSISAASYPSRVAVEGSMSR